MNMNNTNTTATIENILGEIDISKLDNKGVVEQIRNLSKIRKEKREACLSQVNAILDAYKKWREEEYAPLRDKLIAQIGANREAKYIARELKKREAAEKAEAKKLAKEQKAAEKKEKEQNSDEAAPAAEAPAEQVA